MAFDRMAAAKPDLVRVTVPNRGHVPLLTEPECVAALDDFLSPWLFPDRGDGSDPAPSDARAPSSDATIIPHSISLPKDGVLSSMAPSRM